MARAMVTRLGMSTELGSMVYGQKEELIFLGREISEQRDYSEAIATQIDREVRKLVDEAYDQALRDFEEISRAIGCDCQQAAGSRVAEP